MQERMSLWDRIATSDVVKRIKGVKNLKIIVLIFIIALALIIYSSVTATQDTETVSTMTDDEIRLSSILSSVEGAGEVEVMISQNNGEIVGVLVLADGANNPLVRIRLVNATSSALGIEYKIVSVMSRE